MKSEVNISGNRLQITRVFKARRGLVFSFWTTAEHYRRWSGCKEMVGCDVEMDFRVGGQFTQNMKIAVNGGTCDFLISGNYIEIVEPVRIVYDAHMGPVVTRVTVEFFEYGSGTKVVLTQEGFPDESFSQNVWRGTSESFDKLEALVDGNHLES